MNMKTKTLFYRELSALAIPIIIQNLLSSGIGTLDTLMLNWIGQDELAAVSLANQLFFVLNLFFLGLTGSTGIMMAQYLGKDDEEHANQIFTFAAAVSCIVCTVFGTAAVLIPQIIMYIFTDDAELVRIGSEYLKTVGLSYIVMGFVQTYLTALKAKKLAGKSVGISIFTLVTNFLLNAIFIFGLFGIPRMGARGVAVATCIARGVEFLICAADMILHRDLMIEKETEKQLKKDFLKITSPMTLQGFVWGGAMAIMSAIMGHMGSDAVAANSVASTIQGIATVAACGMAEAGSIFLGNDLGESKFDLAKEHAGALLRIAVLCGLGSCLLMIAAEKPITSILNLTVQAKEYLSVMYRILSVNVVFAAITYTMLCGVFPAGGDTRYGLYIDGIVMWGLVLLGSIAAFVLKWNPIAVFVILNVDELTKTPFVIRKYFKWDWVKNITIER